MVEVPGVIGTGTGSVSCANWIWSFGWSCLWKCVGFDRKKAMKWFFFLGGGN